MSINTPQRFGSIGTVSGGSIDLATVPDASDGSKVLMTAYERRKLLRVQAPMIWTRGTVLRVDRDFSTNNLAFDDTTNDLTKFKAIRDYMDTLTGEYDLVFPPGRRAFINNVIGWWRHDTHFVQPNSDPTSCGIRNNNGSYSHQKSRCFNFGGAHPNTWFDYNNWRLAEGVSGDDILAGDDAFVASVSTDYDAVSVGQVVLIVSGWHRVVPTDLFYPARAMFTRVVEKQGSGVIKIDRPAPFDFIAALNPAAASPANTTYTALRADLSPVVGNAFIILDEAPYWGVGTAITERTTDFQPFNVTFDNIGFYSEYGNCLYDAPVDGVFRNCHFRSNIQCWVTNKEQNVQLLNCTGEFKRSATEIALMGHGHYEENCKWWWIGNSGDYGTGNNPTWLMSFGELACGNEVHGTKIIAPGWDPYTGGADDITVLRIDGDRNWYDGVRAVVSIATAESARILNVDDFSDPDTSYGGNRVTDFAVFNLANGVNYANPVIRIANGGGFYAGITYYMGSDSFVTGDAFFLGGGADHSSVTDVKIVSDIDTGDIQLDSTATNCKIQRFEGALLASLSSGSTMTNSGAGTARPEYWGDAGKAFADAYVYTLNRRVSWALMRDLIGYQGTAMNVNATNTAFFPVNTSAYKHEVDLTGVSTVRLVIRGANNINTNTNTTYGMIRFSTDNGATWKLPDNTNYNVTNAIALGGIRLTNSDTFTSGTFTIHSALRTTNVQAQTFYWDTVANATNFESRTILSVSLYKQTSLEFTPT